MLVDAALLSPAALALLPERGATRTMPPSPADIARVLTERGYEPHAAALAFDAAYGGLEVDPDEDGAYLFGAHACVTADWHVGPRGGDANASLGLVPVGYSPNDLVYFLDREGRAYEQDTIEDTDARLMCASGREMLERILRGGPSPT